MAILPYSPSERAEMYARRRKMSIHAAPLGGGFDGIVLATDARTAIKAFKYQQLYRQELRVYRYLSRKNILQLSGFNVPKLICHDNKFLIIEMSIVSPPFIVDFVSADFTRRKFEAEIWEEWAREKKEIFGSDWPTVRRLLFAFEQIGIYISDIHPSNVRCR